MHAWGRGRLLLDTLPGPLHPLGILLHGFLDLGLDLCARTLLTFPLIDIRN